MATLWFITSLTYKKSYEIVGRRVAGEHERIAILHHNGVICLQRTIAEPRRNVETNAYH